MKRCLVVALTFCLSAPWLAGCGGSYGRRSLVELIPKDALVVLSVNWQAVRGDRDLLALIKGADFKHLFVCAPGAKIRGAGTATITFSESGGIMQHKGRYVA